ncbi:hypothetical protein BN1110_06288 [bacterium YEK0313]|nr:hypothetical protein BN1110_06288 [bacterium YEK0313]
MARRSRIISHDRRERLLAAMREARREATGACGEALIGGPEYRALEALLRAIDDVAGELTGDREMFWVRNNRALSGIKPPKI